jgi:MFS family permease
VESFRRGAFVPVLLFVGLVVSMISSLGAPLVPTLANDLHTSLGSAQWALTATVLVGAVASPLVGRLGDGRHRKHVIVACLGLVVLGGGIAALAASLAQLLVGRSLQGMGLALMPLTMAAAREHLAPVRAGRAIAALSVVGAAGVGLGFPVTGYVAEHFDVWTAYWLGSAFSAIALVFAAITIPHPAARTGLGELDLVGAGLIALGLLAILLGISYGPGWGWTSPALVALLALGLTLLAFWAVVELRVSHPLVDLKLIRHRAVLAANVTACLLGLTMYLSMVLVTQLIQLPGLGFDASVFVAGLTLVPLSVLSALGSRTLPSLQRRFELRAIIALGTVAVAAAPAFFAVTSDHLWQAFVSMGLLGIGLGYTFAALPGLIIGNVPARETGSAMGFYQVSRFVGFSVGSGVAVTLVRAFGHHGEPTLSAFRMAMLVAAGLGVATAIVAWLLPAPTAVSGAEDTRAVEEGLMASAGLEFDENDLSFTLQAHRANRADGGRVPPVPQTAGDDP